MKKRRLRLKSDKDKQERKKSKHPHPNASKTFFYSGSDKVNRKDYMYPSERIFSKYDKMPQHLKDLSNELVKLKYKLNLKNNNLLYYARELGCKFTSYTISHWIGKTPGPGFPPTKHTLEGMIKLRNFLRVLHNKTLRIARETNTKRNKQNNG